MNRLHSIIGSLILLAVLAVFSIMGNSLGATALFLVFGGAAAAAFGTTIQGWIAGATLRSENFVRVHARITVAGPLGVLTGIVAFREPRISVLACDDGTTAVIPNALLTSSVVVVHPDGLVQEGTQIERTH